MKKNIFIKTLNTTILSVLIFAFNTHGQDTLKLVAQKRITWLINMATAQSVYDVANSLKASGYRGILVPQIEADETEQGGMFRIPGTKELFKFSCHDGEHIQNCAYITSNKSFYDEIKPAILTLGFTYDKPFSETSKQETYAKNGVYIVLQENRSPTKTSYIIVVQKF